MTEVEAEPQPAAVQTISKPARGHQGSKLASFMKENPGNQVERKAPNSTTTNKLAQFLESNPSSSSLVAPDAKPSKHKPRASKSVGFQEENPKERVKRVSIVEDEAVIATNPLTSEQIEKAAALTIQTHYRAHLAKAERKRRTQKLITIAETNAGEFFSLILL